MNKLKISLCFIMLFALSFKTFADTRPNPPKGWSHSDLANHMSLGQFARCSFSKNYLLQTKIGQSTPDDNDYHKEVLFRDLVPEASSSSPTATYSVYWENSEYKFYFFMNSQVGSIQVFDKVKGYMAESFLDLSDFVKKEVFIGEVDLVLKEDLLVTDTLDFDKEYDKVPGERYTYLKGSCLFLDNYIP